MGDEPEIAAVRDGGGSAGSIAHAPMSGGAGSVLDAGMQGEAGSAAIDADVRGDAMAHDQDPGVSAPFDPEQRVSALSGPQVLALCEQVDQRLGLIGDIAAACRVEAWLSSMSEEGCEAVLADCTAAGTSGLGLELGTPCAARTLPACEATAAAVLACADDNGAFFGSRSCAASNLREDPPACSDELARVCPPLF